MKPVVTYGMAVDARSVTKTFTGDGGEVTALDGWYRSASTRPAV